MFYKGLDKALDKASLGRCLACEAEKQYNSNSKLFRTTWVIHVGDLTLARQEVPGVAGPLIRQQIAVQ